MVKVSVIVPVYNVEPYLDKCLNGLVNQTLKDIEIIVVNDGATDNSQSIIDEYVKKHDNVIGLMKKNGGLSDARNYGIPYAKGEYIGFIDSDDFVEYDMFEILYNKAKEDDADIVECNLRHTFSDSEDIEIGKEIYDKKEMIMFGRSVVWNKIYKREWLVNTKVLFPKGLIYEDVNFFVKLVPFVNKYSYVEPASIHYVQRETSINNKSSLKTLQILDILDDILDFYKENKFYDEYRDALEFLFTRILLCSSFARMARIPDKKDRKMALDKNYKMLVTTFPQYKRNETLKSTKTHQAWFMRTVNGLTYKIYSAVFPLLFKIKAVFSSKKY